MFSRGVTQIWSLNYLSWNEDLKSHLTMLLLGEEQTDTLSDSEAIRVPDALVRQKIYNSDPESSQASCKTKAKKTTVRQSQRVLSRPSKLNL